MSPKPDILRTENRARMVTTAGAIRSQDGGQTSENLLAAGGAAL